MAEEYIIEELEEVNEMTFMRSGCVKIGYTIVRRPVWRLRFSHKYHFGGFNCLFAVRS